MMPNEDPKTLKEREKEEKKRQEEREEERTKSLNRRYGTVAKKENTALHFSLQIRI